MAKFTITLITIVTTEVEAKNYAEAKKMVDTLAPVEWKGRKIIGEQRFKEIKESK